MPTPVEVAERQMLACESMAESQVEMKDSAAASAISLQTIAEQMVLAVEHATQDPERNDYVIALVSAMTTQEADSDVAAAVDKAFRVADVAVIRSQTPPVV